MTNTEDTDKYPTQPLSRREVAEDEVEETEPTIIEPRDSGAWRRPYPAAAVEQEEIRTPPPTPLPVAVRPPGLGLLRFLVGVALVLSIAALVLNVLIIYSFMNVQQSTVAGLDTAIQAIDDFQGTGFHYEYRFERTIPVSSSIPIQQEMVMPFSGDFPINTTVKVPVDAGILGEFTIDVPINTSVHVDTEVPVSISQTFDISTSIPISMSIPIEIEPDDPAIQDLFVKLRAWLLDLRQAVDIKLALPGRD